MKLTSSFLFLLCVTFASPVLADQLAGVPEACSMSGPSKGADPDCEARRVAFRTEVQACMDRLHKEAIARAGRANSGNPHTSRERFLTCDAATRKRMEIASN